MRTGFLFVALVLVGSVGMLRAELPTHLSESQARSLFPAELLGYRFTHFKVKAPSAETREYSATYISTAASDEELKVVILDVLPAGDPKWGKQFSEGTRLGEWPVRSYTESDKNTVMVWVKDRFRVDFKSRVSPTEQVLRVAEKFPFAPLQVIARAE